MSQGGRGYMYPRAEEGRGSSSLDFSQAFKTSHLGEVLCTANPMQQKFLQQQWEGLDRAKRRRENALFHYQRNFFIAQVFGKGLNPHLNKPSDQPDEDDDSAITDPSGDYPNYPPTYSNEAHPPQAEAAERAESNAVEAIRNTNNDTSVEVVKDNEAAVKLTERRKKAQVTFSEHEPESSTMITQISEFEEKPRSRASSKSILHRCQTSGELNSRRGQSQSLPTLTSSADVGAEVTSAPSTARDKLQVSFMQERAKSTSDLADSVSKRVSTSYGLPSINNVSKNSLQKKPEIIVEEDEEDSITTDYEAISVHTTTDHVGLSALRREQRKDVASLRRDPSRLFPKMRLLLSNYDSDTQGTFNQIMNLNGGEEEDEVVRGRTTNRGLGRGRGRGTLGRFASKSARAATENVERPTQRIKFKIRSAREGGIQKLPQKDHDSSHNQNSSASHGKKQLTATSYRNYKSAGARSAREVLPSATASEPHRAQTSAGFKPARKGSDRRHGSSAQESQADRTVNELQPHSAQPQRGYKQAISARGRANRVDASTAVDDRLAAESLHEGSTEGVGNVGQTPGELSETQRYVKMIQQLTAFLPEHLLATAEDQIRKMSNTDQIRKFKKKMIEKNHAALEKDTKTDPRWRRLEGTLIRKDGDAKWHKRHRAWHLNEP